MRIPSKINMDLNELQLRLAFIQSRPALGSRDTGTGTILVTGQDTHFDVPSKGLRVSLSFTVAF